MPEDVETYMKHFSNHGYMTTCVGKMHLQGTDQMRGWAFRPFGDMEMGNAINVPGYTVEKDVCKGKPDIAFNYQDYGGYTPYCLKTARRGNDKFMVFDESVTREAINHLKNYFAMYIEELYNEDRPLLLEVSYKTPHCPFVAPAELFDYYYDKLDLPKHAIPADAPPHIQQRHREDQPDDITEDMIRNARAAYWGLVQFVDQQIGIVLGAIEQLGLQDEFAVMYTTDHGEMAGEKGLWQKTCFYEQSVRCPMIIAGAGLPPGKRVQHNTSHRDLMPTPLRFS